MIVEFSIYDTPAFSIEHLLDSPENINLVETFNVSNDALGLELTSRSPCCSALWLTV